jgi:hypothetical protein
MQKNFFANKNAMKAQQKRPKTEERKAFENLSAHYGCAKKSSRQSKKDGVLQMNCNLQYLQELVGSWHCIGHFI